MKRLAILLTALMITMVAVAQDYGRIAINVVVPQLPNVPEEARAALETKMQQVATQYGLASNGLTDRFVMTAKVNVTSKDVTPTTPVKISQKMEVTMFIGDVVDNKVYESVVFSVSGIGQSEAKSMIQAFNQIKLSNPKLKAFMENGERKISEYYTNNCQFILIEANTLASQQKYDAAIAKLMAVPEVCAECYEKCMDKAVDIYNIMIENECQQRVQQARTIWIAKKDYDAAETALLILFQISPKAKCQTEVVDLMTEIDGHLRTIEATVEEQRKEEWDFRIKQYNDGQFRKKELIAAVRAIGVAYGKNQPTTTNNITLW